MPEGKSQPNSREEYKRQIAADISSSRVEAPQDADDIIAAEPEEDEEELVPNQGEGEQQEQPSAQPPQRVQQTPAEQLEKGQVPKYEAEPPEAYKQPPGGPAVRPKIPFDPKEKREEFKEHARKQAKKELAQAGKEIASKAGQAVKEAAVKAAQAIAKAVAAAARQAAVAIGAFLAEGGWLPVLIILIIIGLAIAAFALWPNRSLGSTITQQTDILGDRPWISKILGLANDPNAAQKLEASLSELESGLTQLEADMAQPPLSNLDAATKQKITAKITEIRTAITEFRQIPATNSAARKASAQKIITTTGQLADLFAPAPFRFAGDTGYMIEKDKIETYTNSLHCGSFSRKERCKKDQNHGTFRQYNKGTSDAIDIYAPTGTPVRAAFSGKVIYFSAGKQLQIEQTDSEGKKFIAVYAHMTGEKVSLGSDVKKGDELGKLKELNNSLSHLHFELYCNERAVVTTRDDLANFYGGDKKYETLGEYLYVRILNALNLSP